MNAKTHGWHKIAIAAATVALLGSPSMDAQALTLGRLTVLSSLGEPLRAEVDLPNITAAELASLQASVAPVESFNAAGLEYSAALVGLKASLQRRNDGRAYLQLTGERTVNDPFIDLILEAAWSGGLIVRDFTLLLDPPALKKPVVPPTLPQAQAQGASGAATDSAPEAKANPTAPSASEAKPTIEPAEPSAPKAVAAKAVPANNSGQRVSVKAGDTASKIANKNMMAGVSLDQMLVALLRGNPDAFVNDNVNRLRAGAIVELPNSESATQVSASEATQIVAAHSKDFGDFKRKLAEQAPKVSDNAAARAATGSVQARVEEKKAAAPGPDKLTLSKGLPSEKGNEAQIAKDREAKEAADRAAELAKNISELNKLSGATAPTSPPPTTATAAAPAAPAAVVPPPPPPPTPAVKAVVPPPPVSDEPSLIDTLLEDPVVPAAVGGAMALLAGWGLLRLGRRRKKAASGERGAVDSRLQPDSFFGASGGQRVDTNEANSGNPSSVTYSASQLDSIDDVDPVAEADVYLAYGRDLQAEEILREAERANPDRLAIQTKLLEIFAKRKDAASFENTATRVHKLTGGKGVDWSRVCDLGRTIDPANSLYQPGGAPLAKAAGYGPTNPDRTSPGPDNSATNQNPVARGPAPAASESGVDLDLDLDLDFSLDEPPVASSIRDVTGSTLTGNSAPSPATAQHGDTSRATQGDAAATRADKTAPAPSFQPVGKIPEVSLSLDDLEVPLDIASTHPARFEATSPAPIDAQPASPKMTTDSGLMEFDLGSLSMEFNRADETPVAAPMVLADDPLGTKLALAEEFISIGDEDGARALIEEVIASASGEMRSKAQLALSRLR